MVKKEKTPIVDRIHVFCVPCTQSYFISRKDDKGDLIEIQICPHLIFKKVSYK
jgi:hypothetical protein